MNEELLSLTFFTERLDRLLRTQFVQSISKLRIKIWKRPDGEIVVEHPTIEEEVIDAFLLNFRVLQQNNDSISICNISPVVAKHYSTDVVEKWNENRTELNQFLNDDILPKSLKGTSRRDFIDCILYGLYAHVDIEKHRRVMHWYESMGSGELNTTFLVALDTYITHLKRFREIIEN